MLLAEEWADGGRSDRTAGREAVVGTASPADPPADNAPLLLLLLLLLKSRGSGADSGEVSLSMQQWQRRRFAETFLSRVFAVGGGGACQVRGQVR